MLTSTSLSFNSTLHPLWLFRFHRLYYMRRASRPISVCFSYGDSPTFLRVIGRWYLASR